ncbi:hypothetical protein PROFUN_13128 [Planoprotostelium fungivorum]|uniref:Uncharacterized protein n=1 Tax=Planoprotostelium fungivorum TaxID=1890364 RepID=A0A2P6N513_9EUKA|nr:hypothetical protein PROFUN_13128 [Planoprotostelium fungivorum]
MPSTEMRSTNAAVKSPHTKLVAEWKKLHVYEKLFAIKDQVNNLDKKDRNRQIPPTIAPRRPSDCTWSKTHSQGAKRVRITTDGGTAKIEDFKSFGHTSDLDASYKLLLMPATPDGMIQ